MSTISRVVPAAVCALALVLVPVAAPAAERLLELDPAASEITFHLDATGHDVEGSLELAGGAIRFDPATGEASGELTVDATSAETGNDKRDKTMHRKVLETEDHPRFVFRAERVEGTVPSAGSGTVELVGTMSIHGSEHPMTLPAEVTVERDRVSATTTFSIPYVEWGMEDPSILFLRVGKEVEVTVRAEGSLGAAEAAASGE